MARELPCNQGYHSQVDNFPIIAALYLKEPYTLWPIGFGSQIIAIHFADPQTRTR